LSKECRRDPQNWMTTQSGKRYKESKMPQEDITGTGTPSKAEMMFRATNAKIVYKTECFQLSLPDTFKEHFNK